MTSHDVLAVVVSYNGRTSLRSTVAALVPQVGGVHVVDNGSDPDTLAELAALERDFGVSVERLGQNRGVGFALNRGVARARLAGYRWLLTMDQDSLVDSGLMAAYRAAIEADPRRVCLTPAIGSSRNRTDGAVRYAITSGNLVSLSLYDAVGGYDEGFFIDAIDFDFSLRVRRAGFTIHRVASATMTHQLGDRVTVPFGLQRFYARHAPSRRYYMYRNFGYLAERHGLRFPSFVLRLAAAQSLLTVLVAFFDAEPLASYRAIARGFLDYLRRRTGPMSLRPQ